MTTALDLIADGWDPQQAATAAAIEAGETHGCAPPEPSDDSIIGPDELADLRP